MDTKLAELKEKVKEAKERWEESKSKEDFSAWRRIANEYGELHSEIMILKGFMLKNHTHPELVDKRLRKILANELLVLRRSMRMCGKSMRDTEASWAATGMDTFARRIQDIERVGTEAIYKQNYVS